MVTQERNSNQVSHQETDDPETDTGGPFHPVK